MAVFDNKHPVPHATKLFYAQVAHDHGSVNAIWARLIVGERGVYEEKQGWVRGFSGQSNICHIYNV